MNIGENIAKFRKAQGISQEVLAEKLFISRQSISKWENHERLPSIENLIALSGILDISIDELITGEAYLQFPYTFGKLHHTKLATLYVLIPSLMMLLFFAAALSGSTHALVMIIAGLCMQVFLYPLLILLQPVQLNRLYTYWQLTKTGIQCPIDQITPFSSYLLPLKSICKRSVTMIPYHDIQSIKIDCTRFRIDPSIGTGIINGYTPRMLSVMYEPFQLIVSTKNGDQYELDLRTYYLSDSDEREHLYSILLFLKRKQIELIDHNQLLPVIKDRKSVTEKIYALK